MSRFLRWLIPDRAFWSYRDVIWAFYDGAWSHVEPKRRYEYMAIYGVQR